MNTEIKRNTPVLYFITDTQGHCKIGIASDIVSRLNNMQVGNANELKILHLKYGESWEEVTKWEADYHSSLADYKIRGEWFKENAVVEALEGKEQDCKHYWYMDVPEFDIADVINEYIILLETKGNAKEAERRIEEEIPAYLKDRIKGKRAI